MKPLQTALSPHQHSLVAWLVMNGVTHEVGAFSGGWNPPQVAVPANDAPPATIIRLKPPEAAPTLPGFDNLESLHEFVKNWKEPGLCKTAGSAILGRGCATTPQLMVVADCPDAAEDASGIGFSGAPNQLILKALEAAGFTEQNTWLTYLSKWRPPGQRNPSEHELSWLIPLFRQELSVVKPRAILLLGDTPSRAIFGKSSQKAQTLTKKTIVEIQELGKSLPILTSPKGEFLVKNKGMKKSFWFSLIEFAATIRVESL